MPDPVLAALVGRPSMSSADTTGRVGQQADADAIRQMKHQLYAQLKRMKALKLPWHGLTVAVVHIGHSRWEIENRGFNETSNHWHADHVYKHQANAILVMWLLTMVAHNLFHAFYHRNLKPAVRQAYETLQIMWMTIAELYQGLSQRPRAL